MIIFSFFDAHSVKIFHACKLIFQSDKHKDAQTALKIKIMHVREEQRHIDNTDASISVASTDSNPNGCRP